MPNMIHLLMQDHRTVERLFEDFEATAAPSSLRRICDELTIHAQLEEEILYPLLKTIDPGLEQEAEQEHREVKQLVAQIEGLEEGDERLVELMKKLKESVEHHVGEEEGEAFPKLQDHQEDTLHELGTKVMERKQQLLSGSGETENRSGGGSESLVDLTKDELYKKAQEADIPGRSEMTKEDLAKALQE